MMDVFQAIASKAAQVLLFAKRAKDLAATADPLPFLPPVTYNEDGIEIIRPRREVETRNAVSRRGDNSRLHTADYTFADKLQRLT